MLKIFISLIFLFSLKPKLLFGSIAQETRVLWVFICDKQHKKIMASNGASRKEKPLLIEPLETIQISGEDEGTNIKTVFPG